MHASRAPRQTACQGLLGKRFARDCASAREAPRPTSRRGRELPARGDGLIRRAARRTRWGVAHRGGRRARRRSRQPRPVSAGGAAVSARPSPPLPVCSLLSCPRRRGAGVCHLSRPPRPEGAPQAPREVAACGVAPAGPRPDRRDVQRRRERSLAGDVRGRGPEKPLVGAIRACVRALLVPVEPRALGALDRHVAEQLVARGPDRALGEAAYGRHAGGGSSSSTSRTRSAPRTRLEVGTTIVHELRGRARRAARERLRRRTRLTQRRRSRRRARCESPPGPPKRASASAWAPLRQVRTASCLRATNRCVIALFLMSRIGCEIHKISIS